MEKYIPIQRSFWWSVLYRIIVPSNPVASRITKTGLLVSIVIGGLGLSAYSANNNLLFIVFSILLSSLFLSLFLSLLHFRAIKWSLHAKLQARAEARTNIQIRVQNNHLVFPLYSLRFDLSIGQDNQTVSAILPELIMPKDSKEIEVEVTLPKRGYNRVELVSVSSKFPFGFVNRFKEGKTVIKVLAWTPLVKHQFPFSSMHANGLQSKNSVYIKGQDQFSHIREYSPGDQLKNIHWKASARAKKLLTKEFDKPKQEYLDLKVSLLHPVDNQTFETLCTSIRQISRLAYDRGILRSIYFPEKVLYFSNQTNQWATFENYLALWENTNLPNKKSKSVELVLRKEEHTILITTQERGT